MNLQRRQILKSPASLMERAKLAGKALGIDHVWRRLRGITPDPKQYRDMIEYIKSLEGSTL